ncbi:polyphenol oxidase family protein [Arthrobacter sp. M4]|uniref:polyphenol oxidase family protein n=1 Tax=Arthrobacter sp. M4 TaxID=218160 RepID=UPI001CDD1DF4|nr:polyphenol oxidase family protein [Arthrobacter sp. M4]MCA4132770.1 polyphenol oxidase family protein [Arthrobacter sp. M4]
MFWQEEVLPGVSVAFTDTSTGNLALHTGDDPDDVTRRRAALESAVGLGGERFHFMNQVHGNVVAYVDGHGGVPTADAMVSLGKPLAVMVADCVPVVLVGTSDSGRPVFGVAHAGRPGTALGIVPAAVAEMRRRGAAEIKAWVGPSICGACYEVPAEMQAEVVAAVPESSSLTSWGTPSLDLPAAVRSQLESAGVGVDHVAECTLENEALFSYRRNKNAGRFAGLVWIND